MIHFVAGHVLPAALSILPARMDTPAARAHVLAIGLQESEFQHRRQMNFGPALGLWQFEKGGGVLGVINHPATRGHLNAALRALCYPPLAKNKKNQTADLHKAIEHNDVLACVFARLNLWWLPGTLAGPHEPGLAWSQYLAAWKPGRPHVDTWAANYKEAWSFARESEK